MKKNRVIKYFLLAYGIISIAIIFPIADYYGGYLNLFRLGIEHRTIFYGSLFFLGTGFSATIVGAYGLLSTAFRKERDNLGDPKRLLRNCFIIGFFVFLVVAPISHFDLLHEEQLGIVHRNPFDENVNRNRSSRPVTYVYLPDIQDQNEAYLKACVEIVKDLRAANARVAIVHFPTGLTLTKENHSYLGAAEKVVKSQVVTS